MTMEYNLKYVFSQLTHHSYNNINNYLNFIFDTKNFSLKNKRVLDVGGGSGIVSFFCLYNESKYVVNLEPNLSSSNSKTESFRDIKKKIKKKI